MEATQAEITKAVELLKQGKVIAHATESVFGFACDPFDADAVTRILQIKRRPYKKGFIVVASSWEQLEPFVETIEPTRLAFVLNTWPGPFTWVFPARQGLPEWIRGEHSTVAARVTAHPLAAELCERYGKALISTSCNRSGDYPTRDYRTTQITFGNEVDLVLPGKTGGSIRPTQIIDAVTGEVFRE